MAKDFVEEIRRRSQHGALQRRARAARPPLPASGRPHPSRAAQGKPPLSPSRAGRGQSAVPPPLPQTAAKKAIGCFVALVVLGLLVPAARFFFRRDESDEFSLGPVLFIGFLLLALFAGRMKKQQI